MSDLDQLRRRVRVYRAGRLAKLSSIPRDLIKSSILQFLASRGGKTINVTCKTFWGDRMRLVLPELVSFSIYRYGFFEEDLSEILMACLKPGQTFFDVGAHFGYFSMLGAHLVGPAGQVHSFEPTPSTFQILSSNAGNRPNVHLNNLALYSRSTTMRFHDFGLTYAAFNSLNTDRLDEAQRRKVSAVESEVNALALDDYVARSGATPDFIKIDAENAELEILAGAAQTILKHHPTITAEGGDDGTSNHTRRVIDHLSSFGYRVFEFENGGFRAHQARQVYGFTNLLFIHPCRLDDTLRGVTVAE